MINNLLCLPVILLVLSSLLAGCTNPQSIVANQVISQDTTAQLTNEVVAAQDTVTQSITSTYTSTATSTYTPPPPTATNTYAPSPTSTSTPTATSTLTPSPTATTTPTLEPRFLVPFRDDFSNQASGLTEENYTNLVTEYVDSSFRMNIMEGQFTQLSEYKLPFSKDVSVTCLLYTSPSPRD